MSIKSLCRRWSDELITYLDPYGPLWAYRERLARLALRNVEEETVYQHLRVLTGDVHIDSSENIYRGWSLAPREFKHALRQWVQPWANLPADQFVERCVRAFHDDRRKLGRVGPLHAHRFGEASAFAEATSSMARAFTASEQVREWIEQVPVNPPSLERLIKSSDLSGLGVTVFALSLRHHLGHQTERVQAVMELLRVLSGNFYPFSALLRLRDELSKLRADEPNPLRRQEYEGHRINMLEKTIDLQGRLDL